MSWIAHSALATIFFVGVILFIKALTNQQLEAEILNLYFFLSTAAGFALVALFRQSEFSVPSTTYVLFLGLAVTAVAYNLFIVKAIEIAPNPAYPLAILSANVVIIALASFVLFSSEINLVKMIGVVLTTVGVVLVSISN